MNKQLMSLSTFAKWLRQAFMAALLIAPALALSQGNSASHASPQGLLHGKAHQIAADLRTIISGAATHNAPWVRDTAKGRLVQVIINADNSQDRFLIGLRIAIIRAGGSVHRR